MVQLTSLIGLASALFLTAGAHTIPAAKALSARADVTKKTPLLPNFASFMAKPERIPPTVKGTATKWLTGRYPTNCFDKAREAIDDKNNNFLPKCPLANLEVYNVTYADCPSDLRDPFILCRCSNSEMSVQGLMNGMGTVPPGIRSSVLQIVIMNGYGGSGGGSDWDSIYGGGNLEPTWFTHESMHVNDRVRGAYSYGPIFGAAIDADTCVPDNYSTNTPAEDFAQIGTWLSYDLNGHKIDYIGGKNISCMSNQLAAAKKYLGDKVGRNSKCFNAPGTDGSYCRVNKCAVGKKRNIIEQDPSEGFSELLPHTEYTCSGSYLASKDMV